MKDNSISNYNRDTEYWNTYYAKKPDNLFPSLFAKSIIEKLEKKGTLLELGCGNGRDSIFFIENGLQVTAIDASEEAICKLNEMYSDRAEFVCGDFVCLPQIFTNKFCYCYSRFSIHAIDKKQEMEVVKNVYRVLKDEGLFLIEVRSVNDEIYGKGVEVAKDSYVYEKHFRRFIRRNELEEELKKVGFEIAYSEEKRGFAPFKGEDPKVIRIIAKK